MTTRAEQLLEQVRSRRRLPAPTERRRIRKKAGVSLRDMGAALGVSHTLIRKWEAGSTPRKRRDAYAQLLADLKRLSD
jgi:transcriptional regulator with XRE-family HTH domain